MRTAQLSERIDTNLIQISLAGFIALRARRMPRVLKRIRTNVIMQFILGNKLLVVADIVADEHVNCGNGDYNGYTICRIV